MEKSCTQRRVLAVKISGSARQGDLEKTLHSIRICGNVGVSDGQK